MAESFSDWLFVLGVLVCISLVLIFAFRRLGFSPRWAYWTTTGLVLAVAAFVQFTMY